MMPHEWPFDRMFDKYTTAEVIAIAKDYRELSQMDRGDICELIEELVKRLEGMMVEESVKKSVVKQLKKNYESKSRA